MNIPTDIYQSLTAPERIRAAISAIARNDDAELETLKKTCPKRQFLMTDPAYAEGMTSLFSLMIVTEYQMATLALDFTTATKRAGMEKVDRQDAVVTHAASLETAWNLLINELGLDAQDAAQTRPPRHPYVTALVQVSEGEEDPEIVETYLDAMRKNLAA
jgi:hypothetical protein